jgi:hypothetical protein
MQCVVVAAAQNRLDPKWNNAQLVAQSPIQLPQRAIFDDVNK